MNYVLFVANDGDFDVVRFDEIMTKHHLELLFFKIQLDVPSHLPIFFFIVNFLYQL